MNRPRNRQPRAPRGNSSRGGGPPRNPGTPQQAAGTVPTVAQVIPGAPVFIILKDDQPTGEETAGVVQDILTRGNHPRGIKVRLRGGLVGRVQRMGTGGGVPSSGTAMARVGGGGGGGSQFTSRYEDVRNDEYLDGPPPRGLADFVPDFGVDETTTTTTTTTGVAVVKCPFCEEFEGDETAVTHHIDQEHLS